MLSQKEKVLSELGLSQNESKIYLSLLEIGSSTASKIAENSGVHRVNVYDSVNKLKEKGLIGEINQDNKRLYQAAPPDRLRNILSEKEIKLNNIIPQLELSNKMSPEQHSVQIFEGNNIIRNMFLHFLDKKEDILGLHIPALALEVVGKDFQEIIHKRRAQQKQMMYHIYHKDAMERIKYLNTLPYTAAGYLEDEYSSTVTTLICGDEVSLHAFSIDDKQKTTTIMIKNSQIADAFRNNFFILWKKTKKPKL